MKIDRTVRDLEREIFPKLDPMVKMEFLSGRPEKGFALLNLKKKVFEQSAKTTATLDNDIDEATLLSDKAYADLRNEFFYIAAR